MIVKNEELNLRGCLSRVADYVDEIVIVDTGSTDDTKSIAMEFTDKVYDFEWCMDFAAARNFSISKASYDWILVLDGDEYITDFSRVTVELFMENKINERKVGRIERINILEEANGEQKHKERINRLFNRNYFNYEGIIHEQIQGINGKPYKTDTVDISAEHIGYTKDVLNRTNKINRNIELLKLALEDNLEDPYIYFQLGKSYYMLKDFVTTVAYFEKALTFKLNYKLEYVSDLVESYGYALINAERYAEAMNIKKYFKYYKNNPDFSFLMGLIYMNNSMFDLAVESFLVCTEFVHAKVEGGTTYLPYYNIGVIYDVLGHRDEAIEYYSKCGDYKPAIIRLKAQLN